jgi:hypothetical protein
LRQPSGRESSSQGEAGDGTNDSLPSSPRGLRRKCSWRTVLAAAALAPCPRNASRILQPTAGPLVQPATAGKLTKTEGQALRAALALRSQATQYATDAAFWYGTLVSTNGAAWKRDLVRRVFSLLHFGGPCYKPNGGGGWQPWNGTDWPIATALSHSARVTCRSKRGKRGRTSGPGSGGTQTRSSRAARRPLTAWSASPQRRPSVAAVPSFSRKEARDPERRG